MKKFLLMFVAVVASLTAQAQLSNTTATWSKSITPVTDATKLSGIHTVVAADGSVFFTGTYNQEVTFGTSSLDPDGLTPAYLAKYDANGNEKWAVGLVGNSLITDLATDADGNVYLLGTLAEKVEFESADGKKQTVEGMKIEGNFTPECRAAFVAKYDKDGNLKVVRTIEATPDAELMASGIYSNTEVKVIPSQLAVVGSKVYLSCRYLGDVKFDKVSWKGCYTGFPGVFMQDNASFGLLTLDAADLKNATSVATVGAMEKQSQTQSLVADFAFTVSGDCVYISAIGDGKLVLETAKGVDKFEMKNDNGNLARAFILASIQGSQVFVKDYHTPTEATLAPNYSISGMKVSDGKLYMCGTVEGHNPLVATCPEVVGTAVFAAQLNVNDLSVNWCTTDSYDEGEEKAYTQQVSCMVENKGELLLATFVEQKSDRKVVNYLNYWFTADGKIKPAANDAVASMATNNNVVAVVTKADKTTTVSIYPKNVVTGVQSIVANPSEPTYVYNLRGQYVGRTCQGLPAGVYMVKTGKQVQKVVVK